MITNKEIALLDLTFAPVDICAYFGVADAEIDVERNLILLNGHSIPRTCVVAFLESIGILL